MPGYGAYCLAALLSRGLPASAAYGLAAWLGRYRGRHRSEERAGVRANLERIYAWRGQPLTPGEGDARALRTFEQFGPYLVDFFRHTRLDAAEVARRVFIDHPGYLREAHGAGRGVIVVTAHLGNWELGGAVLHALGYPVNAVVLPQRMPRLERLLEAQRRRRGVRVLPLGHSALSLVRCLQRGELVALLADRDFTRHHQELDFFGHPIRLPAGAAWLSLRTGAPILPAFLLRHDHATFHLHLHPPLWPEQQGGVTSIMCKLRDILQSEISAQPEQWFVFHDFWAGEPPLS